VPGGGTIGTIFGLLFSLFKDDCLYLFVGDLLALLNGEGE